MGKKRRCFLLFMSFPVLLIIFYSAKHRNLTNQNKAMYGINLAVVSCAGRAHEALNTIKSAIIFGKASLHVYIYLKDENRTQVKAMLKQWQRSISWREFTFDIDEVKFPHSEEWNKLKPVKICTAMKIYLPDMLPDVDSLLYVDTLFLSPPEDFWSLFSSFSSKQIAALSLDQIDLNKVLFKKSNYPFYEPYGLNSGVMLMNLTRMRSFNWISRLYPILKQYGEKLIFVEQAVINVIFHSNPDAVFMLNCTYNLNPVECRSIEQGIDIPQCQPEETGIYILHGTTSHFHGHQMQKIIFKTIYDAVKNFRLGSNLRENLVKPLEKNISLDKSYPSFVDCGVIVDDILKRTKIYAVNY